MIFRLLLIRRNGRVFMRIKVDPVDDLEALLAMKVKFRWSRRHPYVKWVISGDKKHLLIFNARKNKIPLAMFFEEYYLFSLWIGQTPEGKDMYFTPEQEFLNWKNLEKSRIWFYFIFSYFHKRRLKNPRYNTLVIDGVKNPVKPWDPVCW